MKHNLQDLIYRQHYCNLSEPYRFFSSEHTMYRWTPLKPYINLIFNKLFLIFILVTIHTICNGNSYQIYFLDSFFAIKLLQYYNTFSRQYHFLIGNIILNIKYDKHQENVWCCIFHQYLFPFFCMMEILRQKMMRRHFSLFTFYNSILGAPQGIQFKPFTVILSTLKISLLRHPCLLVIPNLYLYQLSMKCHFHVKNL